MMKKGFKGNAAYDGFAIDLLKVNIQTFAKISAVESEKDSVFGL